MALIQGEGHLAGLAVAQFVFGEMGAWTLPCMQCPAFAVSSRATAGKTGGGAGFPCRAMLFTLSCVPSLYSSQVSPGPPTAFVLLFKHGKILKQSKNNQEGLPFLESYPVFCKLLDTKCFKMIPKLL